MLIKFNFGNWKYYYINNNLENHRLDGPSFENVCGAKCWHKDGLYHREGGPAIEYVNVNGNKYYFLNGKGYTEEKYWQVIRFKGYL